VSGIWSHSSCSTASSSGRDKGGGNRRPTLISRRAHRGSMIFSSGARKDIELHQRVFVKSLLNRARQRCEWGHYDPGRWHSCLEITFAPLDRPGYPRVLYTLLWPNHVIWQRDCRMPWYSGPDHNRAANMFPSRAETVHVVCFREYYWPDKHASISGKEGKGWLVHHTTCWQSSNVHLLWVLHHARRLWVFLSDIRGLGIAIRPWIPSLYSSRLTVLDDTGVFRCRLSSVVTSATSQSASRPDGLYPAASSFDHYCSSPTLFCRTLCMRSWLSRPFLVLHCITSLFLLTDVPAKRAPTIRPLWNSGKSEILVTHHICTTSTITLPLLHSTISVQSILPATKKRRLINAVLSVTNHSYNMSHFW